ncbi:MAG: phosphopantetheine-binding protein [Thomasclavelia spiroformis]
MEKLIGKIESFIYRCIRRTERNFANNCNRKELCKIWEEIFCKKSIGITENYYSLGGDSLLATRMLTKIKARFLVKFSIADIMGRKQLESKPNVSMN